MKKKSWRFPNFCKTYCQRKIGTFLWATLYILNSISFLLAVYFKNQERHGNKGKHGLTLHISLHFKVKFKSNGKTKVIYIHLVRKFPWYWWQKQSFADALQNNWPTTKAATEGVLLKKLLLKSLLYSQENTCVGFSL